jgi:hypothetical protein
VLSLACEIWGYHTVPARCPSLMLAKSQLPLIHCHSRVDSEERIPGPPRCCWGAPTSNPHPRANLDESLLRGAVGGGGDGGGRRRAADSRVLARAARHLVAAAALEPVEPGRERQVAPPARDGGGGGGGGRGGGWLPPPQSWGLGGAPPPPPPPPGTLCFSPSEDSCLPPTHPPLLLPSAHAPILDRVPPAPRLANVVNDQDEDSDSGAEDDKAEGVRRVITVGGAEVARDGARSTTAAGDEVPAGQGLGHGVDND